MSPTTTAHVEPSAGDLRAELDALPLELTGAVTTGDVDTVLALQQRARDLPGRVLVADVRQRQARLERLHRELDDLQPALIDAQTTVDQAQAAFDELLNTPTSVFDEQNRARLVLERANTAARIAGGPVAEIRGEIKRTDRELAELIASAPTLLA